MYHRFGLSVVVLVRIGLSDSTKSEVMKPTRSIQFLFSAALLCSVPPQCVAQAPAGLSIGTYAGLTITGSVGKVYTVQCNTNLAQPDGWRGAGIVQLPSSPYLWVDTAAPLAGTSTALITATTARPAAPTPAT